MRLILFDIDGTLIRSHGVGRTAFDSAISQVLGLANSLDDLTLAGLTDPLIIEHAARKAGRCDLPPDDVQRIYALYLEHLRVGLEQSSNFEVLPGVIPLIERLSTCRDCALAIGTGNVEGGARLKLGRAGLNRYFRTGGFGSDARDRQGVLAAGVRRAEALYQTVFVEVWVVGDTRHDISAARQIGARVVAVASGVEPAEQLAKGAPDVLVGSLAEDDVLLHLTADLTIG